jgi:hypothetical protein
MGVLRCGLITKLSHVRIVIGPHGGQRRQSPILVALPDLACCGVRLLCVSDRASVSGLGAWDQGAQT